MYLPGRHESVDLDGYRYGFQGQELDNEVKGEGNSYNYTFRMHDPRLGRFFAVDPVGFMFAWNSPYSFSENKVIDHVEIEGLESGYYIVTLDGPLFLSHDEWDKPIWAHDKKYQTIAEAEQVHNFAMTEAIKNTKLPLRDAFYKQLEFYNFEVRRPAAGFAQPMNIDDLIDYPVGIVIDKFSEEAGLNPMVTSGILLLVDVKKAAKNFDDNVNKAAKRVKNNRFRGILAEKHLSKVFGGSSKAIKVNGKYRYIDNFADGVARESKVGRVSATEFVKNQLQKDFDLLMDKNSGVKTVEWLFSKSSVTGKSGYTEGFENFVQGLNETLKKAGKNQIKLTVTNETF